MLKKLLGTIAGIFIAAIMVGLIESLGHVIFPPPAGVDLKDPETLSQIMHIIPVGAKIAVLVAWFLGAFMGGWVALLITKWNMSAWIVALFMLAGSLYSLITIPHPVWMAIAAVIIPFVAAVLAIRLASRKS